MIAQNQRRKRQPLGLLACLLAAAAAAACAQVAQAHAPATDLVQVPTTSGLVQGFRAKLQQPQQQHANQTVFKFLSVPYAQAPVGALRFQRPRALLGANGPNATLVDATRFAKTCPQFRHLARFISPLLNLDHAHQTSEDCLRLSIYVPSSVMAGEGHQWNASGAPQPLKPSKLLPVIVWIPGEGFDFADERQFDGSQLAQHTQSIVVSVQYRVGILGFLAGAGPNGTRNMGAHDQLAALQWLNRNINAFGGDEQRVTLMGRFSGSMIISTLLTAPQRQLQLASGEPLFQRAILLSGLAVKDWIIEEQAQQEARVERVLEEALKRGYCKRAHLAGCLRELPVEQLVEISGHGWKLVVDDELVGRLDPIEALREQPQRLAPGVEAVLLGETETEGTLCLYRHLLSQQQSDYARLIEEDRLTSDDLFEMIRDDSSTYFKYNFSRANPIQAALEALTTGGEGELAGPSSAQLREKYLEACSAYMVKAHNGRFKRHLQARNRLLAGSVRAKPVDVFHYSLRHKPSFSLAPDYIQTAAHGDDVPLIFGLIYNQQQQQSIDQADLLMTQKMMSYVGNFVHGNHPLLQQHNSIETTEAQSSSSNNNNSVDTNSDRQQEARLAARPLPAASATEGRSIGWSEAASSQVHSLALTDGETSYLAQLARGDEAPKVALISEQDLAKLLAGLQQQVQQAARQDGVVVLPDGQQSVAEISTDLMQASQQQQQTTTPEERHHQQRRAMTRSLRLMDFHHRQQLLAPARTNIQATTTTTTTTNLFGAEISFVSSLVFSSCIIILMLMSICIILSAIVIRNNLAAA